MYTEFFIFLLRRCPTSLQTWQLVVGFRKRPSPKSTTVLKTWRLVGNGAAGRSLFQRFRFLLFPLFPSIYYFPQKEYGRACRDNQRPDPRVLPVRDEGVHDNSEAREDEQNR